LNSKTVEEALQTGVEAADIWKALCSAYPLETNKYS
jgi:hypothetical protein